MLGPRRIRRSTAAIQPLVIDVDAVNAFGFDLRHRGVDGRRRVGEAGAYAGSSRDEVLKDDGEDDSRAVRMSRAQQPAQLARIPNAPTCVRREGPVVLYV